MKPKRKGVVVWVSKNVDGYIRFWSSRPLYEIGTGVFGRADEIGKKRDFPLDYGECRAFRLVEVKK